MKTLKEMIKGKASFAFCRNGELWYRTECGFLFPVPVTDLGDASANAEEKAIFFMRWIKKYLAAIEKNETEQNAGEIL